MYNVTDFVCIRVNEPASQSSSADSGSAMGRNASLTLLTAILTKVLQGFPQSNAGMVS